MPDFDTSFRGGAARRPAPSDPIMQWASGLTTTARTTYAGWLVETNRDDDLDRAMHAAGFQTVTIKHGGGAVVTHWEIETAELFIIAEGLQGSAELRSTSERFGIAYWWTKTEDDRAQSKLRARVLLRPLLEIGYAQPLTLTVSSTLTGDVLRAFERIYDLLDVVKKLSGNDLPFYAFSLPIGPGEIVRRGQGANTKEITVPAALVPATIERDWLVAHYIRKEWVATVEALLDETIRWSTAQGDAPAEETPAPVQVVPSTAPAMSVAEASKRFYARYGSTIGGTDFAAVVRYLGIKYSEPQTLDEWVLLAKTVITTKQARDARAVAPPERELFDEGQRTAELDAIVAGTA